MLDQKTARDLIPLVNGPDFDELLLIYLTTKKEDAYRVLEQSDDEVEIYRAQGQLYALKRMENMRVEIQTIAKGT
jgi:hypothetical protein